jgi:hypothetical protein
MSSYKIHTPGNYLEEGINLSEHGKSLKSRNIFLIDNGCHFTSSLEVYCNVQVFGSGCAGVIQQHLQELFPLSQKYSNPYAMYRMQSAACFG